VYYIDRRASMLYSYIVTHNGNTVGVGKHSLALVIHTDVVEDGQNNELVVIITCQSI